MSTLSADVGGVHDIIQFIRLINRARRRSPTFEHNHGTDRTPMVTWLQSVDRETAHRYTGRKDMECSSEVCREHVIVTVKFLYNIGLTYATVRKKVDKSFHANFGISILILFGKVAQ